VIPAARVAAAIEILDEILAGQPAEKSLTNWARRSRFAGAKDRAAIRDHVFDALRCRRSFAALGGSETGRGLMIGELRAANADLSEIFCGSGHAPAAISAAEQAAWRAPEVGAEALDMPDWIYELLTQQMGKDQAEATCNALRRRAPVWLRVALRWGSREDAAAMLLAEGIVTRPHPEVKTALEVTENARKVQNSSAYTGGFVELQDASSQAAVLALPDPAGSASALDYCAGGGGKSLALADMGYAVDAHDIVPARMKDIPARAARAGVEIRLRNDPQATAKEYDLVLVDAPCSGSGTWRRTPEAKWALTPERLGELCEIQQDVLGKAAKLVRPGGYLAYATCSILGIENKDQIDTFVGRNQRFESVRSLELLPGPLGDGFFLNLLYSK
jgi:16S rRNA (cytosine967-C5)-methyltransferase